MILSDRTIGGEEQFVTRTLQKPRRPKWNFDDTEEHARWCAAYPVTKVTTIPWSPSGTEACVELHAQLPDGSRRSRTVLSRMVKWERQGTIALGLRPCSLLIVCSTIVERLAELDAWEKDHGHGEEPACQVVTCHCCGELRYQPVVP